MPMPVEYQRASAVFEAILEEARAGADLASRHQTWTMIDAVLRVFRRRLSVAEALRFADVLPPLVRAMFVADWDASVPPVRFGDRAEATREVRAVRPHHNFSPDGAIAVVATAIRRHVDPIAFERVLAGLPAGAADFWGNGGLMPVSGNPDSSEFPEVSA